MCTFSPLEAALAGAKCAKSRLGAAGRGRGPVGGGDGCSPACLNPLGTLTRMNRGSLEQAGAGLVVSGEAARECPRRSRQATSPPGNVAADPLQPARHCPRWSRQARYGPGNLAADPLEHAGTGSQRHGEHAGVSGEAARDCPRWSRQATSPPGNVAADPLEAASDCPRWSGEAARECPRWSGQGCS